MQSKLPVRIKKKQTHVDKKKCYCAQLLKVMFNTDSTNTCCVQKALLNEVLTSAYKKDQSTSTQTDFNEFFIESEKKSYLEIKSLLESINCTLEHILYVLQDKKEYLYNKLHEEASSKKLKTYYNKNKTDKSKKKNFPIGKKCTYAWPEISRLYYGQPSWLKHYMQKIAYDLPSSNSNLIICPRRYSWMCTSRPFSCSDINYFQPMRKMLEQKPFGISIYPNPIFALNGQGDLHGKIDNLNHRDKNKYQKGPQARETERKVQ